MKLKVWNNPAQSPKEIVQMMSRKNYLLVIFFNLQNISSHEAQQLLWAHSNLVELPCNQSGFSTAATSGF